MVNRVENIIEHAEQHCKQHGVCLTIKRKQILACLVRIDKALSVYELINACKKEYGADIPAMSIYRTLHFLESENLVHKLKLANKYVACAHIRCDHEHSVAQFLICNATKSKKSTSTMLELQTSVHEADFQLISPQLEMNCHCKECIAKAS